MFTVTDLKQMGYCPRIPFYQYCLPGVRMAATGKMVLGAAANEATELLEHRRSLRAYGLKTGTREFDVPVQAALMAHPALATGPVSAPIEVIGRLDMLIRVPLVSSNGSVSAPLPSVASGASVEEWIPVDYKDSWEPLTKGGLPQHNWQMQVAAYAMLLEVAHGVAIRRAFVYFIPRKRAVAVPITAELRRDVLDALWDMREMILHERMPPPTPHFRRCAACEYRRLCNDVP